MSTLKTTNIQHASAGSPAIVLDADGDATYAGTHDFSAATVTGVGKILQVVSSTYGTAVVTTSTSYVTTSLTATITPSSATSKVLVLANSSIIVNNVANQVADFTIFRGTVAGTNLAGGNVFFQRFGNLNGNVGQVAMHTLDSPATTAAQLYTVGFKVSSATLSARVQLDSLLATMTLLEVSA